MPHNFPAMDIVLSRAEEEEDTSTLTNNNIRQVQDYDTNDEENFKIGKSIKSVEDEGYNYLWLLS